jgi:hypothetical protein
MRLRVVFQLSFRSSGMLHGVAWQQIIDVVVKLSRAPKRQLLANLRRGTSHNSGRLNYTLHGRARLGLNRNLTVFYEHHLDSLYSPVSIKADSHVPCRSTKGLDCVFPIWFTQYSRVWFTHAMPFPCHATNMPFWKRPLKATAGSRHGMCELASAVQRRHVGDLPAFGFIRLPHKEFQEGYHQKHTNLRCGWSVWNQATLIMDEVNEAYFGKDMSACIIYSTKIMITVQ